MTGIPLRMRRLGRDGRILCIPLDHGTTNGPLPGLGDVPSLLAAVDAGGATCIVVHKGLMAHAARMAPRAGLILHASASTIRGPDPSRKRIVATAAEAIARGADALSLHINLGSETEAQQLSDLGAATTAAQMLGLPVLAMVYPRGPKVKDPYAPELVAHAARLGAELGADIVKTPYTGDIDTFRDVTGSCGMPVIVAGGPQADAPADVLRMAQDAMKAGAAGLSIGRNVFQHADPQAMTRALARIVLEGASAEEAAQALAPAKP